MSPKTQEALDHEYTHRKGRSNPNNLRDQMAVEEGQSMWPTPASRDYKGAVQGTTKIKNGRFIRVGNDGTEYGATLDGAVGIWPTPQVDDAKNVYPKENRRETLVSRVNKWPTPRVSDTEGGKAHNVELHNGSFSRTNKDGVRWGVKLRDAVESSPEASVTATLNPQWVSWLMGLPVGWVSLDPLPEEAYQEWIEGMMDGTWWDTEKGLPRVTPSVSGRVNMLKALGNGIVPSVIGELFKRLTVCTR